MNAICELKIARNIEVQSKVDKVRELEDKIAAQERMIEIQKKANDVKFNVKKYQDDIQELTNRLKNEIASKEESLKESKELRQTIYQLNQKSLDKNKLDDEFKKISFNEEKYRLEAKKKDKELEALKSQMNELNTAFNKKESDLIDQLSKQYIEYEQKEQKLQAKINATADNESVIKFQKEIERLTDELSTNLIKYEDKEHQ